MAVHAIAWICALFCFLFTWSLPNEPWLTFEHYYKSGKSSYVDGRWQECVAFMRRALEDYRYYQDVLVGCQRQCSSKVSFRSEHIHPNPLLDVEILSRFSQRALCITRCQHERFSSRRPSLESAKNLVDFDELKPYSYLQFCHWKLGDLERAVAAVYTFLLRNPTDKMSIDNLAFYAKQSNYSVSMLKDLEEQNHEKVYLEGRAAYDNEDYQMVVDRMEESLKLFARAEERCRFMCDSVAGLNKNLAEQHKNPDIYMALASKRGRTALLSFLALHCSQSCRIRLSHIKGIFREDFLPSHYNYLQFAYWKIRRVRSACQAVASFLLFEPLDEAMLYNKRYYMDEIKAPADDFKPRIEAVHYHSRHVMETKLLAYFKNFQLIDDKYGRETPNDYAPINEWIGVMNTLDPQDLASPDSPQLNLVPPAPHIKIQAQNSVVKRENGAVNSPSKHLPAMMESSFTPLAGTLSRFELLGITVPLKEYQLNGTHRFVAEHVLSDVECRELFNLSLKFGEVGSGYEGMANPHTRHENFQGLTAKRAAELAVADHISLSLAKLYFDDSERVRDLVEKYFALDSHLYIDYTHLVCRTAKEDSLMAERVDLSHPVHGDNCILKDGRCLKIPPAFTWRDYSAIVYLNDDFDGGEFMFTDNDAVMQSEVKPRCGRMVGFSGETPHGVKAVKKGTRCVLALWMTLDAQHQEVERVKAQQILAQLDFARSAMSASEALHDHEL